MSNIPMLNKVLMKTSVIVFLIMLDLVTKMPNAAQSIVQISFADLHHFYDRNVVMIFVWKLKFLVIFQWEINSLFLQSLCIKKIYTTVLPKRVLFGMNPTFIYIIHIYMFHDCKPTNSSCWNYGWILWRFWQVNYEFLGAI